MEPRNSHPDQINAFTLIKKVQGKIMHCFSCTKAMLHILPQKICPLCHVSALIEASVTIIPYLCFLWSICGHKCMFTR